MARMALIAGFCLLQTMVTGTPTAAEPTLGELARQAVSTDVDAAQRALTRVREAGPAGLNALFNEHAAAIDAHHRAAASGATAEPQVWGRLSHALDTVAAQYDSHATRLFWYTSLDDAKAAAKATGRPILSLRCWAGSTRNAVAPTVVSSAPCCTPTPTSRRCYVNNSCCTGNPSDPCPR